MKAITTILVLVTLTAFYRQLDQKASRFSNISKSDTTCLKELEEAKMDLKVGLLTYCNYNLRCEKEMKLLLKKNLIYYRNNYVSDITVDGQTDGCYCDYMLEQIKKRHGEKFIDNLLYIADSIYISKNLDKFYDYMSWDKPPVFPGDKELDPRNHSGLQSKFEKLVRYPTNYEYKATSNSTAEAYIIFCLDEFGNANVASVEFIFWNPPPPLKNNFNTNLTEPFEKIIRTLIEKTKWTPAKIKSFNIKSKNATIIYLK